MLQESHGFAADEAPSEPPGPVATTAFAMYTWYDDHCVGFANINKVMENSNAAPVLRKVSLYSTDTLPAYAMQVMIEKFCGRLLRFAALSFRALNIWKKEMLPGIYII